jgi:hypothetical protein
MRGQDQRRTLPLAEIVIADALLVDFDPRRLEEQLHDLRVLLSPGTEQHGIAIVYAIDVAAVIDGGPCIDCKQKSYYDPK